MSRKPAIAPPGPVTLDSVAALAGVSRQTVSNVLHHPGRVAPRTLERVMSAVKDSGYRASLPARQLATRRANAIAVRAERQQDGISGLVLDAFYHGLAEAGQETGLRVLLYAQQADEDAELALVDELLQSQAADAVVLTATSAADARPEHLRARGLSFCAFGRPWGHIDDPHDWVDVDGAAGTAMATDHLLASGHRHIAYLGWPDESGGLETGADRRRGWREALDVAKVAGPRVEGYAENDARSAQVAAEALLGGPDRPDAIVCASDTLAVGVHRAAQSLLGAGGAVTVVGFDATPVARALGLTSVHQPIDQVAYRCIELLRARAADPTLPPQGVLLRPSLSVPT